MDYDEWTPLGRGDPLKNNPTFDYVPPVLDRVQYWLDSHTTEPSAKRDILVLGVTAKKTSPKIPEQFLKFVDGPKFTKSNQDVPHRNDFTGSTGAEPPKIVRTTNFRNGPIDYRNQNRIQSVPASYYPSSYYGHKSKPYTMMLPPPLVQKEKIVSFVEPTQQFSTQTEEGPLLGDSPQFYALPSKTYNNQHSPTKSQQSQNPSKSPSKAVIVETIKSVHAASSAQTTKSRYETVTATPSVSFEKSNLIYQSTQTLSGGWPGGNGPPSTPITSDTSQSAWQSTDYSRDLYDIDHHVAAASSNHEVVVEQNANIIVDAGGNGNGEVVVGQKEEAVSSEDATSSSMVMNVTRNSTDPIKGSDEANVETESSPSSEKMHIVMANSPGGSDGEAQNSRKEPVALVMPMNYSEKKVNPASENTPMPEATSIVLENASTIETEAPGSRPESPVRSSATGSSVSTVSSEDHQAPLVPAISPNRITPSHRQPAYSQAAPIVSIPRQPSTGSVHSFGFPQAPLQSMMHPQSRPSHAMMQFLGSMRPNMSFRPAGSMSMMFPPMTHMHAPPPPVKPSMNHMGSSMGMDQSRLPPMQDFSMMFTDPPAPSSLTSQPIESEDHGAPDRHRHRMPETTTPFATSIIFPVAVSSTEHPSFVSITNDPSSIENSPLGTILSEEKATASPRPPTTTTTTRITTVQSLTTDPIFSHYKQPAKPIRGPMYLIIQGHSKVKTYKPTVTKHGMPIEKNEIVTDRQLSKLEQFIKENTRNGNSSTEAATAMIEKKKTEDKARAEKIAQAHRNSLMSLVENGLGSFTVSPSPYATEEEHQPNSVTTIEINGN
ncbi:hypothetical protein WN55_11559 [Dufourea novaeangliae]|uniref:Uncharacterized protein n=2 Tax=Dufourea novaeangliae TaxID=178035 RepID=A0A154PB15_DUFNO|nr:hypothetical protein WN55_11559 [Dufourea novaeangliae]